MMINLHLTVGFVILCLAHCDAIAVPNHYNIIQTYKSDQTPRFNGKSSLINGENQVQENLSNRRDFDDLEDGQITNDDFDMRQEAEVALKYAYLIQLLQEPPTRDPLPVIYVESEQVADDDYHNDVMDKRSGRYYRRYPWKRQNTRYRTYDADSNKYMCVPSREDVFRLLLGLHAVSVSGDEQKTVTFCSRKRPAKAVFTNIRFLG